MKRKTITLPIRLASILFVAFLPAAFANHRTGDFALPAAMEVADYDKDGNLDLAVCLEGFDNIAILTGDGEGGFTLRSHLKTDTLPKGLASGDMNSDGRLDLAAIARWGYNISISLGTGAGGFALANELNGDGEPTRILLRDVNKDGKLDIVANAPNENKVIVYLGDGQGGFGSSAIEVEHPQRGGAIETGDFNKDGNPDIVVTEFDPDNPEASAFVILLGDGSGAFTEAGSFGTNPQATTLGVADLNKDGNLDLIAGGAGADNDTGLFLSTYLGDGQGSFTVKQINDLGTGSIKGQIALGDFNEDGNMDVAFPQSSKLTIQGDLSTTVLTFMGDGTGNFSDGPSITVGKEPDTAVATDLNKDGHRDLVVSNRTDATVSVLLGSGNGTFTTHATILIATIPGAEIGSR